MTKTIKELIEFGIINLDKPSGPTSFQTAEKVKKLLGLRKMSHFGTLDPKVTGVLPIALNRACKLTGWFMKKDKTYVGIMKHHKPLQKVSKDCIIKLQEEMQKFVGKIQQLPPVKSRVKRQLREREIYSWQILEYDKKKREILFETEVEAGTYIRKLIHDLGLKIGGAHMIELRRTKAGIFSENDDNFIDLYQLEKIKDDEKILRKIIIPADEAIKKILPVVQIEVNDKRLKQILTGKPILKNEIIGKMKKGDNIAVFSEKRFIGIYKKIGALLKPEFVFN